MAVETVSPAAFLVGRVLFGVLVLSRIGPLTVARLRQYRQRLRRAHQQFYRERTDVSERAKR